MEPIFTTAIQSAVQGLFGALIAEVSKPENLSRLFEPECHTAEDVAIDAIDAYKHGKLSKQACMAIVDLALNDPYNVDVSQSFMKRVRELG